MNKNNIMFALIILTIFCLAIGSISANENATDDIVSIEEDTVLYLDEPENLEINNPNETVEQVTEEDSLLSSSDEEILSKDIDSDKLEQYSGTAYLTDVTAKWGAEDWIFYGWTGYFSGSFKVYKDNTCIHDEIVNGYDYDDHDWSISDLDVGTYTVKLIYYDGKVVGQSTINIQKSAVKVSVKSFAANAGTTFYCYAYVTDKYDGANYNGGYVYYKINGKTYKAYLNDGVAILKFKIPSKAKIYTCKATYYGDSQFNGATKTFKMTVKKIKYKTVTAKIKYKWTTKKVGKYKIKYRLWKVRYFGGYY